MHKATWTDEYLMNGWTIHFRDSKNCELEWRIFTKFSWRSLQKSHAFWKILRRENFTLFSKFKWEKKKVPRIFHLKIWRRTFCVSTLISLIFKLRKLRFVFHLTSLSLLFHINSPDSFPKKKFCPQKFRFDFVLINYFPLRTTINKLKSHPEKGLKIELLKHKYTKTHINK